MSTTENTAVVRRIMEEVWNRGNLALIDKLFAPDFVRHLLPDGAPQGPVAERQHRERFRLAFPDFIITADDVIAARDRVVVRYTWRGTHLGPLGEIAATGRRVSM